MAARAQCANGVGLGVHGIAGSSAPPASTPSSLAWKLYIVCRYTAPPFRARAATALGRRAVDRVYSLPYGKNTRLGANTLLIHLR